MEPKLPISVKEAKKQLGKSYAGLSDDDVIRIIRLLNVIASDIVGNTVPK